jgi:hypothetical protein
MGFVKLDQRMLESTTWLSIPERNIFITALLMALPWELTAPTPQLDVNTMEPTGWMVPPGWYGLARVSGPGLVERAKWGREDGMAALEALGNPEKESRSQDHEGRRLVRIDGGYVVLNFFKYRDYDHTAKERQKRYRERKKAEAAPPAKTDKSASVSSVSPTPAQPPESPTEKLTRKRSKPKSPEYTQEFLMWWFEFKKGHPRSGGDKDKAFQAWQTTDHPPAEEMIKIWTRQKRTVFLDKRTGGVWDGVKYGQGYLNHRDWEMELVKDDPQPDSFPGEGLPLFANSRQAALAAQGKVEDGQGRAEEDARGTQGGDEKDWQGAGEAGKPGLEPWRGDALSPDDDDIPFA